MTQKAQDTFDAEKAARLAVLKKIADIAPRITAPSQAAQLAAAYKNVVAPHLADGRRSRRWG